MPHLTIEYSANIADWVDLGDVMDGAYRAAADSGVMDPRDIKIRAISYTHFMLADRGNSFVHLTCRLLAGRTVEQKERLAILLRRNLVELLQDVHSISIDIVDMDPSSYKKRLVVNHE